MLIFIIVAAFIEYILDRVGDVMKFHMKYVNKFYEILKPGIDLTKDFIGDTVSSRIKCDTKNGRVNAG